MIDVIKHFFVNILGARGGVFICSMIPIIELRGSVILGASLGLPWWQNLIISIIGNMLPIPFILLFIRWILEKMKGWGFLSGVARWLERKAEKNRPKVEKYGFWGLCIFVAIPLPGTGAWTGSLVAALIRMNFWKALLSVFLGVLIAGIIMTLASYGVLGFLSFLT